MRLAQARTLALLTDCSVLRGSPESYNLQENLPRCTMLEVATLCIVRKLMNNRNGPSSWGRGGNRFPPLPSPAALAAILKRKRVNRAPNRDMTASMPRSGRPTISRKEKPTCVGPHSNHCHRKDGGHSPTDGSIRVFSESPLFFSIVFNYTKPI